MRGGSSPKKGGQAAQALGRSRGGFSTKIHVSVDGLGNPLRFILTGGQQHDITQAEELIAGYAGEHVLADQGYDAQEFRRHILELGMMPVIPPRSNRKAPADYDRHLYRERHLVECFINKMKHYRRIAPGLRSWTPPRFSRFEKLDTIPGLPAFHRRSHLATVRCRQNLMHLSPGAVHAGPDNPRRWDGSRYRANLMLHHKCQIVNPFYG